MARRPTPKPPPPKAPQEALKWFAGKVPFTRAEFEKLEAEARKRAFFISNVAQLNLVSDVHKAITKAIQKGTTLADFKKAVEAKLTKEWGEERPAVVETIFRTNVQAAYNAGRLEQFEDPLVKRFRPMRGWSVILDGRTTEFICRPLATVVVPADSAFARTRIPPLHFRCRTGIMALSAEDAKEHGGVRSPEHLPHDAEPQEGFGGDPRVMPQVGKLEEQPARLRREFARKVVKEPPPRPPPEPEPTFGVQGTAAAMVEKEFPFLAKAFGKNLTVHGKGLEELELARKQLKGLEKVPEHVLANLSAGGLKMGLGPDAIDELMPVLKAHKIEPDATKGEQRSAWKQVGGVYSIGHNHLVVNTRFSKLQPDILAHEVGHAQDAKMAMYSPSGGNWASNGKAFQEAWQRFRGSSAGQAISKYFTNASMGARESYAETFNILHTRGMEDAVRVFGPELPVLVQQQTKKKRGER